tara:strand:- start:4052 stop:4276 length:225 start_codon:yes stop_codon:yes gene_type:complete
MPNKDNFEKLTINDTRLSSRGLYNPFLRMCGKGSNGSVWKDMVGGFKRPIKKDVNLKFLKKLLDKKIEEKGSTN